MNIVKRFFNNTRKPEGILGRIIAVSMNLGHSSVSKWGIRHIENIQAERIIDLGCGGGKNVNRLLKKFPCAKVAGLDYSDISVKKTSKLNKKEIRKGRCRVVKAGVDNIPFKSDTFDLAAAFETVYFWPGPVKSFMEVNRILKENGIFMIVNESDGKGKYDEKWSRYIDGLRIYSVKQLADYLKEAGFREVISSHEIEKHRICIIAKK